ncbi:THO complex subunit 1 [Schistosoma japonicum]|uniref:Putative UDP-galactose-4-epimerase n=3 Tax=Schistosoma japonicum TaxID=6182 RepID=C1LL51_SCHJA|nr:THO complex subunit 1 [Schistosoma japonicum]CAX75429.1 putative UDP-galactose-4-epimerase [Schistosoma japonicum]
MSADQCRAELSFGVIKDILEDPSGFSLAKLKATTEAIDLRDKKSLIDVALRGRMLRLLASDYMDDVKTLLKMGVAAALANLCSAPTPFLLFSDVFNTKPISLCEEMFGFMEETIITLKDVPLFGSGRNTLLRMCNDLLRRLSKSQNTVFCGQIQLFLTRLFPLDEKSGLNFMSNFNSEKDILYNKNPDPSVFKHQISHDHTSDDLEEGEMTDSSTPLEVDAGLYVKFWSLQEFFKSPVLCYEKAKWLKFTSSTDTVLDVFSSIKLITTEEGDFRSQSSSKTFSKYLTSEKLLDLQLMDPSFRRYILVQLLILFQYLTTAVKFKTIDQVLSEDQHSWVNQRHEVVLRLLSSNNTNSPSDNTFVSTVEHILERESYWNRWKNDGCPSFIRNPEKSKLSVRKRHINPLVTRAGQKVYRFGNRALDKLWNVCPDNLAACRDKRRVFDTDLHSYFQDAIMEMDPAEKVEEEYKSINKDEWSWRALRFLSRKCPHFYINWNPPGRPVKDYLSVILTEKIHSEDDKKGSTPNVSDSDDRRISDGSTVDSVPNKQPRLEDTVDSTTLDTSVKSPSPSRTRLLPSEKQSQGHSTTKGQINAKSLVSFSSPMRTRYRDTLTADNGIGSASESENDAENDNDGESGSVTE